MRDDFDPAVLAPGDRFLQHQYEFGDFLGGGGFGRVFAVRHRITGDRFAAKLMHAGDASDERRVQQVLVSARARYRIRHHNVPSMFDVGLEEDGRVWMLLELLEGQTLAEMLRRYGRFSPLFALDFVIEIAFGLQAAHDLQIIHRDVKPSNVYFTFDGVVKVFNFSLARVIYERLRPARPSLTLATLAYMAPEYLLGAMPSPQFDVYALGLLLWFMLVGRHPFDEFLHDPAALKHAQRHVEPPELAKILGLPHVDAVIRGATAKDPGRRFAGMWPLVQALMTAKDRLLRDAGASAVKCFFAWELQHPIRTNPAGKRIYIPPTTLPVHRPPPSWAKAELSQPTVEAVAGTPGRKPRPAAGRARARSR
jgi:serine/threonine-protein kinase